MSRAKKILDLNEAVTIHLYEIVAQSIVDPNFLRILRNGDAGGMTQYFEDNYPTNYNESYQLAGKFLNDPEYIKRVCSSKGLPNDIFNKYYKVLKGGWWSGQAQ